MSLNIMVSGYCVWRSPWQHEITMRKAKSSVIVSSWGDAKERVLNSHSSSFTYCEAYHHLLKLGVTLFLLVPSRLHLTHQKILHKKQMCQ